MADDVIPTFKLLQAKVEEKFPPVEKATTALIESKTTDEKAIEDQLKKLMHYVFVSIGTESYQKLVEYYVTINEEKAKEWERD